ncbi:hypothetical protein HDU81_000566, partial [Chytriomyces hyalinus]
PVTHFISSSSDHFATSALEGRGTTVSNKKRFENPGTAVAQLQETHESNHVRAINHAGEEWVIPIPDSAFDLDKMEFGMNYAHKSRDT